MDPSQTGKLIRYAEHTEMPWKNGGGSTREIAREVDGARPYWRLSLATVDKSGPFSILPGCERIILLLDGQPMSLHFDDGEVMTLSRGEPRLFSCERPLQAVLQDSGERRDLNLIWNRDALNANVQVLSLNGHSMFASSATNVTLVVATKGSSLARVDKGAPYQIVPGDTLVLGNQDSDRQPTVSFQATGAELVLFTLHKRG